MRVRKVSSNDIKIHDSVQVKLKTAGNTSVVQFTAGNNKTCSVVNLSKDTYLDKKTGEVKQKKKSQSRYQSPKSVRKSINRLMDLIRCNATDTAKCKWITLTYEEVMTDGKQAFLDAKLFLRKLKRYLAKQIDLTSGQKSFQYITIAFKIELPFITQNSLIFMTDLRKKLVLTPILIFLIVTSTVVTILPKTLRICTLT